MSENISYNPQVWTFAIKSDELEEMNELKIAKEIQDQTIVSRMLASRLAQD